MNTTTAPAQQGTKARILHITAVSPKFEFQRDFERTPQGEKEAEVFLKNIKKYNDSINAGKRTHNKAILKKIAENKALKKRNVAPARLHDVTANIYTLNKLTVSIKTI